jgi:hypothetical protein
MLILCVFTYSALRGTFLVVNDQGNEGSGMPVQIGMGQGLLLQKSFAGRKLPSLPFAMKPASRQVEVMAAITTQSLKAKSVQKGTQRIAPPRKPNAPKKTGTQVLKPPSVGTQVNRKVYSHHLRPAHDAAPSSMQRHTTLDIVELNVLTSQHVHGPHARPQAPPSLHCTL